jgi:hypothetical protein
LGKAVEHNKVDKLLEEQQLDLDNNFEQGEGNSSEQEDMCY